MSKSAISLKDNGDFLEILQLIRIFWIMEQFINSGDGFIQITCYFCFEPFEVNLEVPSESFFKNSEIIDCTICCNPNKIDYEVEENCISNLLVTNGND